MNCLTAVVVCEQIELQFENPKIKHFFACVAKAMIK